MATASAMQRFVEEPKLTTLDVPSTPTTPNISVVSTGIIPLNDQKEAIIAFQSSTAGEYWIEIRDASDNTVQSITGTLAVGTNYASWDGRNSFGALVNEGEYSYYIIAQNVGTRSPPAEGDGSMVVTWPIWLTGSAFMLQNLHFIYIGILVVLGGLIAYFLLRKSKLTLYVPVAAADVVSDVLAKHHDAKVEDYVDLTENASRYKGITITNAKSIDQEWLKGIVSKTKQPPEWTP